jgi:hypothetical protein
MKARLGDAATTGLIATAANALLPGSGAIVPALMPDGGGASAPGGMLPNVTVSPAIQTQVSPQISPSFVQQQQPTGSPVSTGATQNMPTTQSATGQPSPYGSAYPGSPSPFPASPFLPSPTLPTVSTSAPSFLEKYKTPLMIGGILVAVALFTQTKHGKTAVRTGREKLKSYRSRRRATA